MSQDLSLREDVEHELSWEPIIRPSEIGVAVRDGVVTLSGLVDSHEVRHAAERAAARIPGVKAVSSQLEVKIAGLGERSDADIAWAAANVLSWNTLVPAGRVRVKVSQGHVTLEGSVDWRFQKSGAENAVTNLAGVTRVTNLISISPAVPAEEAKEQIEATLTRNMAGVARRIVVEVMHDRVTLWGSVDTWGEREAAEQAAWSTPGVHDVSNHITVEKAIAFAAANAG